MSNYLCNACVCCYTSIDTKDIKLVYKESNECLCLTQDCCIAMNEESLGLGLVTGSGDICKIALGFCSLGLKKPTILCAAAQHCLCLKSAASVPFDSAFVGEPLCSICFVKLYPEIGVLKQAPGSSAITR